MRCRRKPRPARASLGMVRVEPASGTADSLSLQKPVPAAAPSLTPSGSRGVEELETVGKVLEISSGQNATSAV
jgi:hypothetical protein